MGVMKRISRKQFIMESGLMITAIMAGPFSISAKMKTITMEHQHNHHDVVIVGGSYAGLSAAMALGRALKNVIIIDNGKPCNRQTPHSHNVITLDGEAPAAIAARARSQVMAYPTVTFIEDTVTNISGSNNHFSILTASGKVWNSRKVLLATGIRDIMPDIPGFAACWGISVLHCPFCHGYEVKEKTTGIITSAEMALEMGRLIHNWTADLRIFTNGDASMKEEHTALLQQRNIRVVDKPIREIVHEKGQVKHILFQDGSSEVLDVIYSRVRFEQYLDVKTGLGCTLTDQGFIQADDLRKTTVPGVFAAGDNAGMFRAVSVAIAAGTTAGAMISKELMEADF
jgi:thioredoxin reductase